MKSKKPNFFIKPYFRFVEFDQNNKLMCKYCKEYDFKIEIETSGSDELLKAVCVFCGKEYFLNEQPKKE